MTIKSQIATAAGALLLWGGAAGIARADSASTLDQSKSSSQSTWKQTQTGPNAQVGQPDQTGQQGQQGQMGQVGQAQVGKKDQALGVIQKVDRSGHALTLILPQSDTVAVTSSGKITELSREQDMVSLSIPVEKSASVMKDGKTSSFDQLKMGDNVRVSFDPKNQYVTKIDARSLNQNTNCPQGSQGSMDDSGALPKDSQGGTNP